MRYSKITKTPKEADGRYKTVIQRKNVKIEKNNTILFTNSKQERLTTEGIYKIIKRNCKRADKKIIKETDRNPNYTKKGFTTHIKTQVHELHRKQRKNPHTISNATSRTQPNTNNTKDT